MRAYTTQNPDTGQMPVTQEFENIVDQWAREADRGYWEEVANAIGEWLGDSTWTELAEMEREERERHIETKSLDKFSANAIDIFSDT